MVRLTREIFQVLRFAKTATGALLLGSSAARAQQLPIALDPASPDAYWLAAGTVTELPTMPRNGLVDLPYGNIGWFDYLFTVSQAGWRQANLFGVPNLSAVELDIDPVGGAGTPARGSFRSGGWVWLTAGKHRLRVSVTNWTGLPQIKSIRLDPLWPSQPGAYRVLARDRPVTATGRCQALRLLAGGFETSAEVEILFRTRNRVVQRDVIPILPSTEPREHEVAVPCATPGDFEAQVIMSGAPTLAKLEVTQTYTVFAVDPTIAELRLGQVAIEIDASDQLPDYGNGDTRVVDTPAGRYRESSDVGATRYVRGASSIESSWFAYRVSGLEPDRPYLFEVDYPDDAERVMVAAFRDSREAIYPSSVAMETGGVWPKSGKLARRSAVVWPQSGDARVIFYAMHDGQRAAVSRIRFRKADIATRPVAPLPCAGRENREVTVYSEEGGNVFALVGKSSPKELHEAAERYVQLASLMGANTLVPTVAVYNFQLYPSRYNVAFQDGKSDITSALMLAAQQYGLRVVPELHLRADELMWSPRTEADVRQRLLVSGDGRTYSRDRDTSTHRPPYFNPLTSDVQAWYRGVIGELADRYKDFPNFAGVQLRIMGWQNPALNNLVSLEWGYNAEIVAGFFRETGIPVPEDLSLVGDAPEDVRTRHRVLTGQLRERWVTWRCEQIASLLRKILADVRAVRSDLKVRLSYFGISNDGRQGVQEAREAGIDFARLTQIDGLEIVDARYSHGAKEASLPWQRKQREEYRTAPEIGLFTPAGGRALTLEGMKYLEINDRVAPSQRLGWPQRRSDLWISAASEPPGRAALARYAELVGYHDVYSIGDGGNGYIFGSEEVRDFMQEFACLPRIPFERIAVEDAHVALRQKGKLFYLINLSSETIDVRLSLSDPTDLQRLVNGTPVPHEGSVLAITLRPYELQTYQTRSTSAISGERRHN
jgi:hypothetical protein